LSTANTVAVRQAVAADIEALAVLFDQYRQFQGQAGNLISARSFLSERFDHGESIVFLATIGGTAVGFAQLYRSYSSVSLSRLLILNDLFVHEAVRRQRVASQLLSAVESYAWSFGASRVTLNVARTNVSAQQVYTARGWKQDDEFFMFHRFPATK
jgi:GNAT superfamily N-acetyltransferase